MSASLRGTNDYGVTIPRTSTKASVWEAALEVLRSFNVPKKALPEKPTRTTLVYAYEQWAEMRLTQELACSEATLRNYKFTARQMIDYMAKRGIVYLDELTTDRLLEMRS